MISLPPRKSVPPNPFINRRPPALIDVDRTPVEAELRSIKQDIKLCQVKRTKSEMLYNKKSLSVTTGGGSWYISPGLASKLPVTLKNRWS